MRIVHVITGLGDGGAENTLFKICLNDESNKHIVISLKGTEKYSLLLKKAGIDVYHLEMKFFSLIKFINLINLIKYLKGDVVQTWLIHGDLIGGLAAKLSGHKNIIWNVRYSNLEKKRGNIINILFLNILSKLSYVIPKIIITVSKSAKKNCERLGYDKKKLKLIYNGYDLSVLKFDNYKKKIFRNKNKIKKNILLIANVARFAPMKDHMNLLKALALLKLKNKNYLCILAGTNIDKNNKILINQILQLKLKNNVKLIGKCNNIPLLMNAIDIYIQSSSYGEGFPNVVAEAMAFKTPCIVTNVGDAASVVGKTGWVIPPKNPVVLSNVLKKTFLLKDKKSWKKKCDNTRSRILQNFNLDRMMDAYRSVWKKSKLF